MRRIEFVVEATICVTGNTKKDKNKKQDICNMNLTMVLNIFNLPSLFNCWITIFVQEICQWYLGRGGYNVTKMYG